MKSQSSERNVELIDDSCVNCGRQEKEINLFLVLHF